MLRRVHGDTCGLNATIAKSQLLEAYEGRASLVQARLAIVAIINRDSPKNGQIMRRDSSDSNKRLCVGCATH